MKPFTVFTCAQTEVDRIARTVLFQGIRISKGNFPTLPDKGAAYAADGAGDRRVGRGRR
jgi:hypothetical protein